MRVCFVAPSAYPLFDTAVEAVIGGLEIRSALFARRLAKRPGCEVLFLVDDFGQAPEQHIDGVRLVTDPAQREHARYCRELAEAMRRHAHRVRECLPRTKRFPGFGVAGLRPGLVWDILAVAGYAARFRFFPPRRRTSYWAAERAATRLVYAQLGADVYVGFGANAVSAEMVASCRRYGGTSVLFLASDLNLNSQYVARSRRRDVEGEVCGVCHYALARADHILVQTAAQQRLLKERFGRDSLVIRSPIALDDAGAPETPAPAREFVLWIGRADRHTKRPALCLELAARCPQIPFLMVLNHRCGNVADEIRQARPTNVTILERVPPEEMAPLFRRARAMVNTSSYEGLPNTFLQAGKYGAPVLSLEVDPDGMLDEHGCGLVAGGSLDRLAEQLRRIWNDAAAARALAGRMTEFLWKHHEAEGRVSELEAALRSFSSRRAASARPHSLRDALSQPEHGPRPCAASSAY